jgi:hypothetical protein
MNPAPDARAKTSREEHCLHLLAALDSICLLEIGICYYLDNSFLLLLGRTILHILVQASQARAQLFAPSAPLVPVLTANILAVASHLLHAKPEAAARSARGYLYGGLLIVFEGQPGPISKWRLVLMDLLIFGLQLLILCVNYERRAQNKEKSISPSQQDVEAEEEGRRRSQDEVEDAGPGDAAGGIEMESLLPESGRTATRSPDTSSDDTFLTISLRSLRGSLDRGQAAAMQTSGAAESTGAMRLRALLARIARERAAANT